MNSWNFTGRLGRDAEVKFMPNGDAITIFSVAVDSGYGDKKTTSWPRCTMFGKRAPAVAPHLKKGAQVAVSGELSERKWINKEGLEQVSLEVRVHDLTLVGGKQENLPQTPVAKPAAQNNAIPFDETIPF